MLGSVPNYAYFQLVIDMVDVILCPFLAFRLDFLIGVKLHFVCAGKNEFLLHIILFSKLMIPKSAPNRSYITNQGEIA
jgi:hypothetical protein